MLRLWIPFLVDHHRLGITFSVVRAIIMLNGRVLIIEPIDDVSLARLIGQIDSEPEDYEEPDKRKFSGAGYSVV
jgi:hypothetical protein